MGKTRTKWIELRFGIGRVATNLEIQKVEITTIHSKNGGTIAPQHNKFQRGANKGEIRFRLQKGAYRCKITANLRGKTQTHTPELILNEKDYSWKGLLPIFDQHYAISFFTFSSH